MAKKRFIVKVQLPVVSSDKEVGVLVYNEDRSIMQELPVRSKKEVKELKMLMHEGECGEIYDGLKNYFYAHLDNSKGLILTGLAPMQDW